MSAERLREAARVLRERAEGASDVPGPWWSVIHADGRARVFLANGDNLPMHGYPDFAAYIATMHPGVGLALADWLDTAGADLWAHGPLCDCGSGCTACDDDAWQPHVRRALALADLILGGTQ